jgi:hypothetical protein
VLSHSRAGECRLLVDGDEILQLADGDRDHGDELCERFERRSMGDCTSSRLPVQSGYGGRPSPVSRSLQKSGQLYLLPTAQRRLPNATLDKAIPEDQIRKVNGGSALAVALLMISR